MQSGVGGGRGNDQNHSHEAVTADFASDEDGSLPDNSLPGPNRLHRSNFSAGEMLATSYVSAVLSLTVKTGKRAVDELLAIVHNPNLRFSEMAKFGSSRRKCEAYWNQKETKAGLRGFKQTTYIKKELYLMRRLQQWSY